MEIKADRPEEFKITAEEVQQFMNTVRIISVRDPTHVDDGRITYMNRTPRTVQDLMIITVTWRHLTRDDFEPLIGGVQGEEPPLRYAHLPGGQDPQLNTSRLMGKEVKMREVKPDLLMRLPARRAGRIYYTSEGTPKLANVLDCTFMHMQVRNGEKQRLEEIMNTIDKWDSISSTVQSIFWRQDREAHSNSLVGWTKREGIPIWENEWSLLFGMQDLEKDFQELEKKVNPPKKTLNLLRTFTTEIMGENEDRRTPGQPGDRANTKKQTQAIWERTSTELLENIKQDAMIMRTLSTRTTLPPNAILLQMKGDWQRQETELLLVGDDKANTPSMIKRLQTSDLFSEETIDSCYLLHIEDENIELMTSKRLDDTEWLDKIFFRHETTPLQIKAREVEEVHLNREKRRAFPEHQSEFIQTWLERIRKEVEQIKPSPLQQDDPTPKGLFQWIQPPH